MTETRQRRVEPAESGQRLDRVLAAAFPDLTRSRLQRLIEDGHVTLDGRAAKSSERVKEGALLALDMPAPTPTRLVPEDVALDVVYEDDDLGVINKPAGMVVHPGAGVREGTLVHALLSRWPQIAGLGGVGGVARPGIVHRLDKDTSGLLVVARTDAAFRALQDDMAARRVKRRYLALTWGAPGAIGATGRVETAIGRDPKERTRMAVRPLGAFGSRASATRWRVLALAPVEWPRPRFGLLSLELETGRTHQIRVHLAHIGHPVVADATYGGGAKKALSLPPADRKLAQQLVRELGRQALHAETLAFRHPTRGEPMTFRAPLPDDLVRAFATLGLSHASYA
jgi:23S rRNA pseudouridine1911/1915/1917 synthase